MSSTLMNLRKNSKGSCRFIHPMSGSYNYNVRRHLSLFLHFSLIPRLFFVNYCFIGTASPFNEIIPCDFEAITDSLFQFCCCLHWHHFCFTEIGFCDFGDDFFPFCSMLPSCKTCFRYLWREYLSLKPRNVFKVH